MSGIKKKRVSKKNKASWRKFTDIKDVEDFLEDQRLEERIGKADEKKDDELFTIDTAGGEDKTTSVLSLKARRKENAKKPPRSLLALENTSKVQDPIAKRNHVKPRKSGKDVISQVLAGKTSNRITQALRESKRYSLKLRKEKKLKEAKIFRNNLWEEKDELDDHPEFKNQWIEKDLAVYHLHNTGTRLVARPTTADLKTTRARALELPHPGMSYNPSLKDHRDLLNEVLEREGKIIKEEKHLKRVTTDMFSKLTPAERDLEKLKEAASGLNIEGVANSGDEETENPDAEGRLSINPPVQNKKKDRKARRKQREQRELLQERMKLKLEKKKITDIHRLRFLKAEVADEEKKTQEIVKRRKQTAEEKKFKPRRLAKIKFQESDIPVNMVTDLSGNLRNLKTESNVLIDRFKSMQRRNILPPSVDVGTRKRRKIKRFVRSSHKEDQQPIVKKKAGGK